MNLRTIGFLAAAAGVVLAAPPPGMPDGWSDGYVCANGIRIHYYHAFPAPGKPVIVMLHGGSDNGLCWTTLTQELQNSYDIYMPDARAHGLTDPYTDADKPGALVQDAVAFIRAMKLEKPILMGHSLGAATVRDVGVQYPDLARAIIMLDPGLGRGASPFARPGSGAQAPAAGPMTSTPETLVAQNNASFESLVAKCRTQTPKWDPVDCQYWALSKRQYHGTYTDAQRQSIRSVLGTGDTLAKITVPVLILKADAAPDVRKANEEAARVIKNGKLVHIDGAGHNLHHDQRKRTVDELTAFLKTL